MKRRWLLVPVIALVLVAACCIGAVWVFQNEICDGTLALKNMDTILQDIRRQRLLTDGTPMWGDLQRWLKEAPGPYRLVLINLEIPVTPGNDATVGVQLSNGKAIVCSFYNRTLEGCSEVDQMPWPQECAADSMKAILEAARKYPAGEPSQDLLWPGLPAYMHTPHVWEDLQKWLAVAPGDFQIEVPAYVEYQCGYVSYTVKAHLSNDKTIVCEFEGRAIRSCEEVK